MWEGIKSWKANSPALSTIYRLTRHCLLSHHSDCQSCLQPLLVNTVYMPDHWMLLYLNERVYCERNARATSITLSRLCIGLIQEGTSALLIHLAAYTVMLNLVTKTLYWAYWANECAWLYVPAFVCVCVLVFETVWLRLQRAMLEGNTVSQLWDPSLQCTDCSPEKLGWTLNLSCAGRVSRSERITLRAEEMRTISRRQFR